MRRGVVLFELNEVPWTIVDTFIDRHPDSTLADLCADAYCFTSIAADAGHLSPWTTWPTLHRGVNDEQHLIASFGQDRSEADREYPPIWELVHRAGLPAGVCGTLHTYPVPDDLRDYAFYLPDAFASDPAAHPPELETFQQLNLTMSRESARNVDTGVPRSEAMAVLKASKSLGIRPRTYASLAGQLVSERRQPWKSNRRRSYQSVLLADLFMAQLRRTQPAFSSLFTNHVASAMHRYWAAARPDDYGRLDLDQEWLDTYRDEVDWAMLRADDMLGRLARFVASRPGYVLVVASSMGQFATQAQALETQVYVTDLPAFMVGMGLPRDHGWEPRPAMLPQCNVAIEPEHREAFEGRFAELRVGGEPVHLRRTDGGFYSMTFGQDNLHDRKDAVTLAGEARPLQSMGLAAVEIEDRSGTTAYHVPEGVLIVHDPASPASDDLRRQVSVLEVAPAILSSLGIAPPGYMKSGDELAGVLGGRSRQLSG